MAARGQTGSSGSGQRDADLHHQIAMIQAMQANQQNMQLQKGQHQALMYAQMAAN